MTECPRWAARGSPQKRRGFSHAFSSPGRSAKASGIFDVALRVLELADAEHHPAVADDRLAEERMAGVGGPATIRSPH